ncbi:stage II sporulation protein Q [Paraliobacillus quinghaiensis]|uniref:Stage II sporulation protein Q n=1 Tax=Paraliobacillus quinghaiensis TaxID=470815 RepID=A0A917TPT6_9BACI|nr:M23 family metallopeptidase [Paraliobacillus quinghaiensis]GGM32475.1 stage II sporulation protein Q [Paraliobacillus quinghaiensis]
MKEENKGVSKNNWKRVFKKKWFFPAVYLTVAALLLAGVLWYQNLDNQIPEATDTPQSEVDNDGYPLGYEQDSSPVVNQSEVIKMPVLEASQTEIVTKFYAYEKTSEEQEQALVLYDNKYYQSKGIDIASTTDETFPVTAALSGEVIEVKQDPLLGYVIEMKHDNGVTTHYASLQDVTVTSGEQVDQGEALASAGKNVFNQANGTHVHFEVRKDGEAVDPEQFLNKPLSDIEVPTEDDDNGEEAEDTSSITSDEEQEDEDNSEDENDSDNRESSRATTNA